MKNLFIVLFVLGVISCEIMDTVMDFKGTHYDKELNERLSKLEADSICWQPIERHSEYDTIITGYWLSNEKPKLDTMITFYHKSK